MWNALHGPIAVLPLLLAATALPAPTDVDYALSPAGGADANEIAVTLRCVADPDGRTEFELEREWGGHRNDGSDVSNLAVADASGRALEVRRDQPWSWSVAAPEGTPLVARYAIRRTPPRGEGSKGNDYRTRLDDRLFQCIGHLALLAPRHLSGSDARDFGITLKGFADAGWDVTSSWGPGEGTFARRLPSSEFMHSMILAAKPGAARLHRRAIGDRQIGFAIVGDDWGFTDDQFIALATKIVTLERDFFRDHSDPWFLVTATPEGGRASPGAFSLGGTGLLNCFALYCNAGLSLDAGSPYADELAVLLAHEYFHTWNGTKMQPSDGEGADEEAGYGAMWFSEGFTNYFARKILHRAGVIDDATFARKLSEALGGYDANPFRSAPNDKIREQFWTDRDVGQLPYQRGDLVALAIDERMTAASNGARTLDDLMRELVDATRAKPTITNAQLLERITAEVGPEFAAQLRAAIFDGADVPIPERVTRPELRLSTQTMRTFDPGLEIDASHESGTVKGVRDGTEAYRAGLRNGQKLVSATIVPGADQRTAPKAVIEIEIDGATKRVEYDAISEPKRVRRYAP
ncbi:MAG: hypothetical protein U0572_15430 [Phycisphaerales bacterium]